MKPRPRKPRPSSAATARASVRCGADLDADVVHALQRRAGELELAAGLQADEAPPRDSPIRVSPPSARSSETPLQPKRFRPSSRARMPAAPVVRRPTRGRRTRKTNFSCSEPTRNSRLRLEAAVEVRDQVVERQWPVVDRASRSSSSPTAARARARTPLLLALAQALEGHLGAAPREAQGPPFSRRAPPARGSARRSRRCRPAGCAGRARPGPPAAGRGSAPVRAGENPPSGPISTPHGPPCRPPSASSAGGASPASSQNISGRSAGQPASSASSFSGASISRHVQPPGLLGRLDGDGGEAVDAGPLGVGALGDRQPHAPRAKLGRLLDDGLQPRPLDQRDDQVEVRTDRAARASRSSTSRLAAALADRRDAARAIRRRGR